ncbi:MAG: glycosyltransferase family 2 protein [Bacteroidales bacterium]|nr:glycosyltransferase family 2 protein [Bacteroidales bacterium]
MLSVLIPVYNFDVRKLVKDIIDQCNKECIDHEVLVIDDASDEQFREINRELEQYPTIKYQELENNIGRSKIRNLLANQANYNYLLYMDCDSKVATKDYIKNYKRFFDRKTVVVYGGRDYTGLNGNYEKFKLHWNFGKTREVIPACERQLNPSQSFMTNNFLITKPIFNQICFNEKLKGLWPRRHPFWF